MLGIPVKSMSSSVGKCPELLFQSPVELNNYIDAPFFSRNTLYICREGALVGRQDLAIQVCEQGSTILWATTLRRRMTESTSPPPFILISSNSFYGCSVYGCSVYNLLCSAFRVQHSIFGLQLQTSSLIASEVNFKNQGHTD